MKRYVYKLQHKRKIEPDGDDWVHDTITIGYFSTLKNAEQTIERYKNITGFQDYPDDFCLEKIEVDFDDYDFI